MPINLDKLEEIKQLDTKNMLGSIEKLPNQVQQIAKLATDLKLPVSYKKAKNIVFLGMGGSSLGSHCIKVLFEKELPLPMAVSNDYDVPAFVGRQTLAFVVSYSGMTEETVSALERAKAKGAMIVVVTTGGDLEKIAKKYRLPCLLFNAENNPCGSPRMGLGYTFFGPLILLANLGYLNLSSVSLGKAIEVLQKYQGEFGVVAPESENFAKQLAEKVQPRSVWYVGAGHLGGSVHVAANQMNENGKRFAGYFVIPELNHHLLEGLPFPKNNSHHLHFVFVESGLYSPQIQKRFAITKEILRRNDIPFDTYVCKEKTSVLQAAEMLVLGSYIGYYTALLSDINPTDIPVVDYFKSALK